MTLVAILVGVGLILLALRDITQTVFRPQSFGVLSRRLMRANWSLFHRLARRRRSLLSLAGPVAMIGIIISWTGMLVIGWACIYWPFLPERFTLVPGLEPARQGGFLDAVYLSMVTIVTLGYGDIAPQGSWLRILGPLEAFVGFALITASISWVLSVNPILARRRNFAHEVTLIADATAATGRRLTHLDPDAILPLLASVSDGVISVRGDLAQFPVTYYFRGPDPRYDVAAAMPALGRIVAEIDRSDCPPAVRFQAALLDGALRDLAADLAQDFLDRSAEPLDDLLCAYAGDHGYAREAGCGGDTCRDGDPLTRLGAEGSP